MSVAQQLQPAIRAQAARRMAAATGVMVAALDAAVPVDKGTLKRARRVSGIRSTQTGYSVDVSYPGVPQAGFTEDGTRPHTIRAKRARALRFVVGGRTVYARVVHHPGTRAQHWFSRTVNAARWAAALARG